MIRDMGFTPLPIMSDKSADRRRVTVGAARHDR